LGHDIGSGHICGEKEIASCDPQSLETPVCGTWCRHCLISYLWTRAGMPIRAAATPSFAQTSKKAMLPFPSFSFPPFRTFHQMLKSLEIFHLTMSNSKLGHAKPHNARPLLSQPNETLGVSLFQLNSASERQLGLDVERMRPGFSELSPRLELHLFLTG
jgi:hypothetical protein